MELRTHGKPFARVADGYKMLTENAERWSKLGITLHPETETSQELGCCYNMREIMEAREEYENENTSRSPEEISLEDLVAFEQSDNDTDEERLSRHDDEFGEFSDAEAANALGMDSLDGERL